MWGPAGASGQCSNSKQKAAGSIPGDQPLLTIVGPCKKAVFPCLASDFQQDNFTFVGLASDVVKLVRSNNSVPGYRRTRAHIHQQRLENCFPKLRLSFAPSHALKSQALLWATVDCVVSVYPHRLLAFSQNVRPGEGSGPTGPKTGKLQSLMTSRAGKGTQDLRR